MLIPLPQNGDNATIVFMKLYCQFSLAVLILAFLKWLLFLSPAHRKHRPHPHQAIATSPFGKLPPELRAIIYRYTLLSHQAIDVSNQYAKAEPALLITCRLFRTEARCIFYYENQFFIPYTDFCSDRDLEFPSRMRARAASAMCRCLSMIDRSSATCNAAHG